MNTFHVLIDNGHGKSTPGKCSPDKRILEYDYCRKLASCLKEKLKKHNIQVELVVPEPSDISLKERCKRVNNACSKYGSSNCLLISLHINAFGSDSNWHSAKGWCAFVSNNASAKSKRLAAFLTEEMLSVEVPYLLKGNRSVPPSHVWQQNLAICRDTNCPAVLTENLFQDNMEDVDFLCSPESLDILAEVHLKGILKYIGL